MSEAAVITSRDNPLLVRVRRLAREPAATRKLGWVWLEGEHLCRAALGRGVRPRAALLAEHASADPAWVELAAAAARVHVVADALWKSLSTLESPAPLGFLLDLPGAAVLQPDAPTVVLDRVQDAGNVGSILRSAAALGVAQVVALAGSAGLWTPKVLRAAMGAHFALRLIDAAQPQTLAALRVPLLVTGSHDGVALPRASLPWPCAWVFGHEGQGVQPSLRAHAALAVRIPQPGGEESLNVAAAAAICLYESLRARSR
ncbi:RNA methyltransferase [Azohydromonas sp.]|uniref:TrmH family RNA methyltransferase n=1 Tax=Azohydromonas sp. TaxID=1872666 RepID=UPI002BB3F9A0|nr:RNA methyltransferase [Azohydromonas sp.]HMM85127.1 RNA methyltransferase [Azohydromonas sp.]